MDVESLFAAALQRSTIADREAFLDQACAGDVALRRRVERLIAVHEKSLGPLDRPAGPPDPTEAAEELPRAEASQGGRVGTTVAGRYTLLREIGEGGMGTVYLAEQVQPVRRKVALKLIKAGMGSRAVLARFDAERQALALMDHPNIAKVHDGGTTEDGRPFFVMEYVEGVPITEHCDAARLSIAERLALLIPVCRAVQHAHAKGVIHRDLKPSNILVCMHDGRPVPKVIDFGLAKATHQPLTEQSLHTAHGALLGTPLYMSPEQARFNNPDVDTRTDVYALGAVLFELLTGTTPLERRRFLEAAWEEALRLIREEDPPRPSDRLSSSDALPSIAAQRRLEPVRLTRLVRGELDWIVMKCLEKDRARRYATADGLARDLQHYLQDEAVEACPPSAGYRAHKFVRRNRGPVIAASVVFLLLVIGILGTTWGLLVVNEARGAEARRAEGEKRANALSRERLELLEKANEMLLSVFRNIDPRSEEQGGKPLRAILGDRLVEAAERMAGEGVGDPLKVADLHYRIALTLLRLGSAKNAIPIFDKVRAARAAGLGPRDVGTLTAQFGLATAYQQAGLLDQALPPMEEVLALRKETLGPDHPHTLFSMNNLASLYQAMGEPDRALPLLEETLRLRKARLGDDHADTLTSMNNLAVVHCSARRFDQALRLNEEVLRLRTAKLGPDHPDTLNSMNSLAMCLIGTGKADEAATLLGKTLELRQAKLGRDHPDTLVTLNNLAKAYQNSGRPELAVGLFEENLSTAEVRLGPDHPWTITSLSNLAMLNKQSGKPDRALPLLLRAAAALESRGFRHEHAPFIIENLIGILEGAGRFADSESWHRKWLATKKPGAGAVSVEYAFGQMGLAGALMRQSKWSEAEGVLRESLAVLEVKQPDSWQTHDAHSMLGESVVGLRRFDEAEPLLTRAYEALAAAGPRLPQNYAHVLGEARDRLVRLYEAWGKPAKAAKWREKRGGPDGAEFKP